MRRGTRVGQAYIAVTADGDGINEEIVGSVESAGPGIEKAGDEHGEEYGDHFSKGFFARMRSKFSAKIGDELSQRMGQAGDDAGDKLGSHLIQSLRARLSQENDKVAELVDRILNDNGRSDKRMGRLTTALAASERNAERLNKELSETLKVEEKIARAAKGLVSGNGSSRLGDRIGGLFGAGSRNNALNVFGNSVAGITNLTEGLFKGLSRFPSLLSKFSEGFSQAAEGASLFEKIGAGLGKNGAAVSEMFGEIAATGPGAAVAVVAIAVAMTVLVSIANALLAILVALVATIASALVGALAVGAAGFAAIGAAAGLATLAFMSMDDAQKALIKEAFKPLYNEAIGLGQVMLRDLIPAFDEWSHNLQVALALAKPLADVMGGALAQAGSIFTSSLSGPGFQLFIAALSVYLPRIITNLSSAMGGFLNGALGLFAAILPYVLQFAQYLDRVAQRFSDWATSASGQNAIVDFVGRALTSLQSLWNFVSSLGGLLSAVLFSPSGQQTGNNIFDRMAAAVRRFTDYISKDDRLEHWFQQGLTFAIALGEAIKTVGQILQDLNQSGVIDGIARIVEIGADAYSAFSALPRVLQDILFPLQGVSDLIGFIGSALGALGIGGGSDTPVGPSSDNLANLLTGTAPGTDWRDGFDPTTFALPDMPDIASIMAGLQSSGAAHPQGFVNPYQAFADSLIKDGPSVSASIRNSLVTIGKQIAKALRDAAKATDPGDVRTSMQSLADQIKASAETTVNTAQDALSSAAQTLSGATTQAAADKALIAVKAAQKDLAAALKNQEKIQAAAKRINAQGIVTGSNVRDLLAGLKVENATLADFAAARAKLAVKIDAANKALTEALRIHDEYKNQVTQSIMEFGSLITAQAQVINGVEQALTSNDIVSNLQEKLAEIKKFQDNLRILLARGLSAAAYKQLVDAGVAQGGAYAEALVAGGAGAVGQVNSLVSQIESAANALGTTASNRLYQAGVDAAKGLVDGLNSLSGQLDKAAARLGNRIAKALKDALGIQSPSKVMLAAMDHVGDGIEGGLDNQHVKVGRAAGRLSDQIAVSPEVAAYASARGESGRVSGNNDDPRFRDLVVHTPTEDPIAVAHEVLNEVVGRL